MPRAKIPYRINHQPATPVPLTAAVQAWLLVRGLHGGPHQLGHPSAIKYRGLGNAGEQAQLISAQVLQQMIDLFKS
ncbi:hypothetical protein [Mucilaginibacter sp. CSA2-8R]|uniref:hypothetical protein n=1 Tax=Mucilaginibacter sp. CSA2-8R TaxID=3141542 RepID=UPI00315D27FF